MSIVQALQQAGPFQIMERLGFDGTLATLRGADVNRGHSVCIVAVAESDLEGEGLWDGFQKSFNLLVATPRSRMLRPLQCGREPGVMWAAYEFADGMHLGKAVRDMGLPTIGDALRLAAQTLEALHSLHGSRTVHRILSPASIFVRMNGEVALHHCGWAPAVLGVRGGVANASMVSILPFLAPEVVSGGNATEAADFYSLGANLYFLVTGQPPVWADTPEEIAQAIVQAEPDMGPVHAAAPPEVAELLSELLDKDPEERPTNFDALLRRIAALADRVQAMEASAPPPDTEKLSAVQHTGVSNDATVRLPAGSAPPPPPPGRMEAAPAAAPAPPGPPGAAAPPPPPPPGAGSSVEDSFVPPPMVPAAKQASLPPPAARRKSGGGGGPKIAVIAIVVILLVVVAGAAIVLFVGGGDKEPEPTVAKPKPTPAAPVDGDEPPAETPKAGKPAATPADGAPAPKPRPKPAATGEALSQTKQALAKAGAAQKRYLADNGISATKLSELALPKEGQSDAWGTVLEIREDYIVSAGPDKLWDTDDDLWVEATTGTLGP